MPIRREKKRLGDMLIDARVITDEQLGEALAKGRENGKKIGENLIEMGFTTEVQIAKALSSQLQIDL